MAKTYKPLTEAAHKKLDVKIEKLEKETLAAKKATLAANKKVTDLEKQTVKDDKLLEAANALVKSLSTDKEELEKSVKEKDKKIADFDKANGDLKTQLAEILENQSEVVEENFEVLKSLIHDPMQHIFDDSFQVIEFKDLHQAFIGQYVYSVVNNEKEILHAFIQHPNMTVCYLPNHIAITSAIIETKQQIQTVLRFVYTGQEDDEGNQIFTVYKGK